MPLIYFTEHDPGKPVTESVMRPLRHALTAGDNVARSPVKGSTPSGSPGILFALNPFDFDLAYVPDHQTWQKIPGERAWVGTYKESRPKPEDLTRRDSLPGLDIRLADGNRWTIPLVRIFPQPFEVTDSSVFLPKSMTLDDDGTWQPGDILPKYRWLLELLTPYWDQWLSGFLQLIGGDDGAEFDPGDVHTLAAKVLGANYRAGPAECALLGLFDTMESPARTVVEVSLSIPVALQWWVEKKSAALSGDDSGLGQED